MKTADRKMNLKSKSADMFSIQESLNSKICADYLILPYEIENEKQLILHILGRRIETHAIQSTSKEMKIEKLNLNLNMQHMIIPTNTTQNASGKHMHNTKHQTMFVILFFVG